MPSCSASVSVMFIALAVSPIGESGPTCGKPTRTLLCKANKEDRNGIYNLR
jgi:hypothetical protein